MVTAAMGGEFEVPTIDQAKTKVKVPSGTQSGRRFRVAGKGMPVLRSRQTGDMYVQVVVETPQNLTKKQKNCWRSSKSCRPATRSLKRPVSSRWSRTSSVPVPISPKRVLRRVLDAFACVGTPL
jgi:DnaJ-class molecular chaperone